MEEFNFSAKISFKMNKRRRRTIYVYKPKKRKPQLKKIMLTCAINETDRRSNVYITVKALIKAAACIFFSIFSAASNRGRPDFQKELKSFKNHKFS